MPDELKGAIGEGLILNPDKPDSVAQVVSHWIAELGEVGSTFRKADIDSLKSFITKDTDVFRPPYAARANKYVRRTIFFATVNDTEFLQDMTGNRRYWTLDVAKLNFKHNMDVQQFWAEIKSYYDDGAIWWLTMEEQKQLEITNKDFVTLDPIIQRLETGVTVPLVIDKDAMYYTVTEILDACGVRNPTRKDLNAGARWLREQGLEANWQKRWCVNIPVNKDN